MGDGEEFGFTFKLNVDDNVSSGFDRITAKWKKFMSLFAKQHHSVKQTRDEFGRFTKSVTSGIERSTTALSTLSMAMDNAAYRIARVTGFIARAFSVAVEEGIRTAAEFEASNARLEFSLQKVGLNYDEIRNKIDLISLQTVATRQELTDMVTTLAIQKVNVFDSALDGLSVTMADGSKRVVNSMEVINDAIQFSGMSTRKVMKSIQEAVSEKKIRVGRHLSEDLNLAGKELGKWNKALKDAGTQQEAFNALVGLMAERVGGATAATQGTLDFILKQMSDWRDKLADMLFKDTLTPLRNFFAEIGAYILELAKNDGLKNIREAIGDIAKFVTRMGKVLFSATKTFVAFAEANPWVVKLTVAVGALAVALSGLLIVLAGTAGVVFAFKALLTIMPLLLAGLKTVVSFISFSFLPTLLLLSPLILGLGFAVAAFAKKALKAKSIADLWDRLKLVAGAVVEGIKNMGDETTTLSRETAIALDKAGLLDFVWNLLRVFNRLKQVFIAVGDTFERYWPALEKAGTAALTAWEDAIKDVGSAFGIQTNLIEKGADSSMDTWVRAGIAIAETFLIISLGIIKVVEWLGKFLSLLKETGDWWGEFGGDLFSDAIAWVQGGVTGEVSTRGMDFGEVPGAEHKSIQRIRSDVATKNLGVRMLGLAPGPNKMLEPASAAPAPSVSPVGGTEQPQGFFGISQQDMKAFAGVVSLAMEKAVTKANRKNPPKVFIDGRQMTDAIAESAAQEQEAGR